MRVQITNAVIIALALFSVRVFAEPDAIIRVDNDQLIINGWINPGQAETVEQLYSPAVKRLVITSTGGNVADGLRIGKLVREKRLEVEVLGLCLSSCANYIFTAAPKKWLGPIAMVCFHGNTTTSFKDREATRALIKSQVQDLNGTDEEREVARSRSLAQLDALIEDEAKFYRPLGLKSNSALFDLDNYPGYALVCPTRLGFRRYGIFNIEGEPVMLPMAKMFVDNGLNGLEMQACGSDLKRLREGYRCFNWENDLDCVRKDRTVLSDACSNSIGTN